MPGLLAANLADRGHPVPKHPPPADDLVPGDLPGGPQAKTGLSALALKRPLGVSYPTAWLIQHKLMQAMAERDARYRLDGQAQVDDAYLGGEL